MNNLFTVKLEPKYGEEVHVVSYKGKEVFRWWDNANIDYPEDLCWKRMISEVFYDGVKVGQEIGSGDGYGLGSGSGSG